MRDDFSTHAENFSGSVNSSINPRTGLYNVGLQFVSCSANNALGPVINFGLTYDPLSLKNLGFGTGFSLGLTQYDSHTGTLSLSSGEQYHVTETTDQPVILQKKLNNFNFIKSESSYSVVWKNGITETLMGPNDLSKIKMPVELSGPMGHAVNFLWDYTGDVPRLTAVKDSIRTLLSVEYNDDISTVLSLFPGSNSETLYILSFANKNLIKLVHRSLSLQKNETVTAISLEWLFSYQTVGDFYLIAGMDTPSGLREDVVWQANVMRFPDKSGLRALPAVVHHTRTPGAGQPAVVKKWSWSDTNYLGLGGNNDWEPHNDNVFGITGSYEYSSTETLTGKNTEIITTRTFNKFHQMTEEQRKRDGAASVQSMEYYADVNETFEKQPEQFLLIRKKEDYLRDSAGNSGKPVITLFEYDDQGNPISSTSPDGILTTYIWYDPKGEDGCPSSNGGFTRYLKQKSVTFPTVNGYSDVPSEVIIYTYSRPENTAFITQQTQEIYSGDTLIKKIENEYVSNADSSEFGRITAITEKLYNTEDLTEYATKQTFITSFSDEKMTQKTTITTHDGLQVTTSRTVSVLTGFLLEEIDSQGVKTVYEYDSFGRITRRALAPHSDYEHITTWSYNKTTMPSTTETAPTGAKTISYFDGEGRLVKRKLLDINNTGDIYEVYNAKYNDIGEAIDSNSLDWLTNDEDSTAYTLNKSVEYSEWGEAQIINVSSGLSKISSTDPIKMMKDIHLAGDSKSGNKITGVERTHFDERSFLPIRRELIDTNAVTLNEINYVYDGHGRTRKIIEPCNVITEFSYDYLGREVERLLPDGSRILNRYAPHLTEQNAIEIVVLDNENNSWTAGRRSYDGLGRLVHEDCGGRSTRYTYIGSNPLPSEITQPDGSVLKYTYIPELGNVVSTVVADNIIQTFTYDPLTGKVLTACEGDSVNKNEWAPSGSLNGETITRDEISMTTEYSRLLSDAVVTWKDVNGKSMVYFRDEYSRIIKVEDEALTVDIEYDPLGRINRQTMTDIETSASLVSTIDFDDFGREVNREINDSNGTCISERLTWYENGLLGTRETAQNDLTVRLENYSYDSRKRLIGYEASGKELPADGYGNLFKSAVYVLDSMSNIKNVTTTLIDNTVDVAAYHYDNPLDLTQLTSVSHTHSNYPQMITLKYDDCGRLIQDESGRTLSYDSTGRLLGTSSNENTDSKYFYDAGNRLIKQYVGDGDIRNLYYAGNELVSEIRTTIK